jgi:hypothetical protein
MLSVLFGSRKRGNDNTEIDNQPSMKRAKESPDEVYGLRTISEGQNPIIE